MKNRFLIVFFVAMSFVMSASAETMDKPQGFKIGQRLTLVPYVSLSATYDNNISPTSGDQEEEDDVYWTINPSLAVEYRGENSALFLTGYYNYRAYCQEHEHLSQGNEHSYGENLRFNWGSDAAGGWSLILTESFMQARSADDLGDSAEYNGYCQDRTQVQFGAAVQHRFTEQWHADVNGSYYYLDYDNTEDTVSLYGWQRWVVGLEAGFVASQWTDILLTANYQGYTQDNAENSYSRVGTDISDNSCGYTVQGGLGSYATKRLSYRVLVGWTYFDYGDCDSAQDGFSYSASGNWKIGETWNTMLLASRYYQPSERNYGSSSVVDALSWGLAKSMIRGKLNATLNLTYRHDTNERQYDGDYGLDYELDEVTARLAVNYYLNRFFSVFAAVEYIKCWNDESDRMYNAYDYDRWRVSIGGRISY